MSQVKLFIWVPFCVGCGGEAQSIIPSGEESASEKAITGCGLSQASRKWEQAVPVDCRGLADPTVADSASPPDPGLSASFPTWYFGQ